MKKKMMKQMTAVLLLLICLTLGGCGGTAKDPKNCKDWTEGVMEINGGIITVGKTGIDEFKTVTGFDEEVERFEFSDGRTESTHIYLSDGYSVIGVTAEPSNETIIQVTAEIDSDKLNLDIEHTTIIGPGGIMVGSSTVEDLAEYDKNLENYTNFGGYGVVNDSENTCSYAAGKSDGSFSVQDGYIYSVYGDLETRIVCELMLKVAE